MTHKINPVGNHIYSMLYGVHSKIINNHKLINRILNGAINLEKFSLLKTVSYKFKPQGLTLAKIISESSIVLHTYPEHSSVELEISTCRSADSGEAAFNYIVSKMSPLKYKKKSTRSFKTPRQISEGSNGLENIRIGNRIPKSFFITSGTGESNITANAGSYHIALKEAGIEMCNIMHYSSILPKGSIEVVKPKLITHGGVMETREARADAMSGERATAGIGYGWLYDKHNNKHGGIVAEYNGNLPMEQARKKLALSLEEIASGFEGRQLKNVNFRLEITNPKKKYGTALVSLCFVDYIIPIKGIES